MPATLKELERWLTRPEGERLEFKAAHTQFDADDLTRYCVAMANQHGGHILLGVNDREWSPAARPSRTSPPCRGTKAIVCD